MPSAPVRPADHASAPPIPGGTGADNSTLFRSRRSVGGSAPPPPGHPGQPPANPSRPTSRGDTNDLADLIDAGTHSDEAHVHHDRVVPCPYCRNDFVVPVRARAYRIECPNCGKDNIITPG
jgi:hypothetical protein